jgi:hypothetical protein
MSSLFLLFRPRQGLPSRPSRTFLGRDELAPLSSCSSTASPNALLLARSVMATFRAFTSSPRSISISLPCVADSTTGFPCTFVLDAMACAVGWAAAVPCATAAALASAACRLASSDSMYSSLPRSANGHTTLDHGKTRDRAGTHMCLLTNSPANPV